MTTGTSSPIIEAASPLFTPVPLRGNGTLDGLAAAGFSADMAARFAKAPLGPQTYRGISFEVNAVVILGEEPVTVSVAPTRAPWLVFLHAGDEWTLPANPFGPVSALPRRFPLGERMAEYTVTYEDGKEIALPIRCRHEIMQGQFGWPGMGIACVPHRKPAPMQAEGDDRAMLGHWGHLQCRAHYPSAIEAAWTLWAWENPHPEKAITTIRFSPVDGKVIIGAISAGQTTEHPLRWRARRKAVLKVPEGETADVHVDELGRSRLIQLDLGQVISLTPRREYPNEAWDETYNNQLPTVSERELIIEYASHAEARFHLPGGTMPVSEVEAKGGGNLRPVAPSDQSVRLRVVEQGSRTPVAARLHLHGEAGEYLAPVDRHRIPNLAWFEDYSVDYSHNWVHHATYIDGETTVLLPQGRVYLEITKGFEIRPIRRVYQVTPETTEIEIEVEKVLPWRERGWITADTHVHFLSPQSAMLEGAGEGVNIVNVLASQWGELMTNVGDFDGKTTHGAGSEYQVRVGTENRQFVLGHISLLGYEGNIIAPMTTGGPQESAIGDPVSILLTEWAQQCKAQNGLVVLPHFPHPRLENAATIVSGNADAIEMAAWSDMYSGIDPYSLLDWYRYLNNGYLTAAVAGTDKMAASTAVGTIRTYAWVGTEQPFTYEAWKDAVRQARTFVSYGPLLEFLVEGQPAGSRLKLYAFGGTVDVTWEAASVTTPMTEVALIVNGEIRESRAVQPDRDAGHFTVKVDRSSWIALMVRGKYPDRNHDMIAAHTSPVMVEVEGSPFYAAADALSILQQIEGALAYLDTVATRAEAQAYQRMRLLLTSVHRTLHNRMHQQGHFHEHTMTEDHREHH
ncbi:MAG: CehA/McbA family metallohydrolase [Armatimonadota bacterium]